LNSDWYCVYVQTPDESADRIDATLQRKLVDNIQLAQSLGAEVVTLQDADVAGALTRFAAQKGVTLMLVGRSHRSWWKRMREGSVVDRLLRQSAGLDVLVVASDDDEGKA
jgi:two-component system sensor histidine kinase KdpD